VVLDLAKIAAAYSHGHHVAGDDAGSSAYGADSFNFVNTAKVGTGEIVVGRLEDFDASRDHIRLDGVTVNLSALPSQIRVLQHNGDHNDPGAPLQQWLAIKTSGGGHIFYALEGARVDMTGHGGANSGQQEAHFLASNGAGGPGASALALLALYNSRSSAGYADPQDAIPAGAVAKGGATMVDWDQSAADVRGTLVGTASGVLIAAGLNDDWVNAGAGDDQVWGGSGHDTIFGGIGNDTLTGNLGNDMVNGGEGRDRIVYFGGHDTIIGGTDVDTLVFSGPSAVNLSLLSGSNPHGLTVSQIENIIASKGADYVQGDHGSNALYGGVGSDALYGLDGADLLSGGDDADRLFGGDGADQLFGGAGNDTLLGQDGVDRLTGGAGNDLFRYQSAAQGGDFVLDFGTSLGNDDRFSIAAAGFGGGLKAGSLSPAQFRLHLTNRSDALDADDRFIFNNVTHRLSFDADGLGGAGPVLIATMQDSAASLTSADIWLF
jgi:Ca2+-binding RTX toxin-like protein